MRAALLISIFTLGTLHSAAHAHEVRIVPRESGALAIEGLQWSGTVTEIQAKDQEDALPELTAHFRGSYDRAGWNLTASKKWLLRMDDPERSFETELPINGERSTFQLIAFDGQGKHEEEEIIVEFPEWKKWKTEEEDKLRIRRERRAEIEAAEKTQRAYLTASVGYSYITYNERNADFSSMALMPQVDFKLLFKKPSFGLHADAYTSVLSIAPSRSDVQVLFWGVDLHLFYTFWSLKSRWRLSIVGGGFFKSMSVTNDAFGYRNMIGPQLYPVLSFAANDRHTLSGYFRFSPTLDGLFIYPADKNYELAFGFTWAYQISPRFTLPVTAEVALVRLSFPRTDIFNNTYTLSVGFGL